LGHFDGVGVRELLDHEQQVAIALTRDVIADEQLVVFDDGGHVSEAQLTFICILTTEIIGGQRDLSQVVSRLDGEQVLDAESLVGGIDEPAGAGSRRFQEGQGRDPQGIASGLDDVEERDIVLS
jgi:hypothetical protein